jgi:hypothetical protein
MKAHEGVDAEIHVFLTSALVGESVVSFKPQMLYPWRKSPLPIGHQAGWAQGKVSTMWRTETSCSYQSLNSNPLVVQLIVSCYTKCTIPTCFTKTSRFWKLVLFLSSGEHDLKQNLLCHVPK